MNLKVTPQQFKLKMEASGWSFEVDDGLFEDMLKAGFILVDRAELERLLVSVPSYVRSSDLFQFIKELLSQENVEVEA